MSWPRTKLGELATLVTKGTTPTSINAEFTPKGIPFLRINNLVDGQISFEDILHIDRETHKTKLRRSVVKAGDVLITIAGTIGKTLVVADELPEMNCNQAIAIIRLTEGIDSRYLTHWLATNDALRQVSSSKVTATISNLSLGQIKELRVPLPPLKEQKRIAAILDKADAIRRKRQQAIELADEFLRAVFLDMFGDPVSEKNPFSKQQLLDLVSSAGDIKCGPFGTQLNKSEFASNGVPLWGIKHVNRHFEVLTDEYVSPAKALELASYSLVSGDIVMTRKGTVGNSSVYPVGFATGVMHSDLLRVRLNTELCLPEFLSFQFSISRDIERQIRMVSSGAIMLGINVTKLKGINVMVPPLALQKKFVDVLGQVSQIKDRFIAARNSANDAFNSISASSFSNGSLELSA